MGDCYQIALHLHVLAFARSTRSITITEWILPNKIYKIIFHSTFEGLVLPQNTLIIALRILRNF